MMSVLSFQYALTTLPHAPQIARCLPFGEFLPFTRTR